MRIRKGIIGGLAIWMLGPAQLFAQSPQVSRDEPPITSPSLPVESADTRPNPGTELSARNPIAYCGCLPGMSLSLGESLEGPGMPRIEGTLSPMLYPGGDARTVELKVGYNHGPAFVGLFPKTRNHNIVPLAIRFGEIIDWGSDHGVLRGNLEPMLEISGAPVITGIGTFYVGVSGLLRYNFVQPDQRLAPYMQLGMGISGNDGYRDQTQTTIGQSIEFLLQAQLGFRYLINDRTALNVEGGWLHMSNGGLARRNQGVNTLGASIGVTYFYGNAYGAGFEHSASLTSGGAPMGMSEETQPKPLQLSVAERIWASFGQSTWSLAGPSLLTGLPVSPISDLKWRKLYSTTFESDIDAVLSNRFVSRLRYGTGGVRTGTLDDFDYNGDRRTNLGSHSQSLAPGDALCYLNADFGLRILSDGDENGFRKPTQTVDVLVGYQFWRERYVASNTVQTFSAPPYSNFSPVGTRTRGDTITELWLRNSFRLGLRGNCEISDNWSVNSQLMFVPWSHNAMVDDHLTGVPRSFRSNGDGGFGTMWDVMASYHLWKGFTSEFGYQIWYQNVSNGSIASQGNPNAFQLRELSTLRHGPVLGLKYSF